SLPFIFFFFANDNYTLRTVFRDKGYGRLFAVEWGKYSCDNIVEMLQYSGELFLKNMEEITNGRYD
ncbi:MAG: hypothetical protein Q4D60_08720, partial [Eubacteriales bacterium]|nr:hypothetical protein [Eubacteriales bacterium]